MTRRRGARRGAATAGRATCVVTAVASLGPPGWVGGGRSRWSRPVGAKVGDESLYRPGGADVDRPPDAGHDRLGGTGDVHVHVGGGAGDRHVRVFEDSAAERGEGLVTGGLALRGAGVV